MAACLATSPRGSDFGQLALRCAPSATPSILASIARTASAFEPLAINDNMMATSGVPATRDVAMQLATKLLEAGHWVDIGIMQINSTSFQKLGLTLGTAFDPCESIPAAVLTGNFAGGGETHEGQPSALRVAISKYNTGDARRGFDNGYVYKVELAARRAWWQRCWFSLNGKVDIQGSEKEQTSSIAPGCGVTGSTRATTLR